MKQMNAFLHRNKIIIFLLMICSLIATISSCKKKGCTDAIATNYNADAKDDDGTCQYETDQYAGNYLCTDSTFEIGSGDFFGTSSYIVDISKHATDHSKMVITEFPASTAAHEMTFAGSYFTFTFYVTGLSLNVTVTGNFSSATSLYMEYGYDNFYHHIHGAR